MHKTLPSALALQVGNTTLGQQELPSRHGGGCSWVTLLRAQEPRSTGVCVAVSLMC